MLCSEHSRLGSNELLVLKLVDINCSVMFVATAFPKQPEPAPASTCGLQVASIELVLFGALQNTWKRVILQFKALFSRKGPVLPGMTVCLFMGVCASSGAPGPPWCPTAATSSQLAASVSLPL